jgi:histidyl-tRNA synthetase
MKFQAIKGVRDILPPESALWNRVEHAAREVFAAYGYGEIRLPIFEPTELFARSIGAETDVVSKEMFTFPAEQLAWPVTEVLKASPGEVLKLSPQEVFGQRGSFLSLRPEATASAVRAYIEHGMHTRPGNVKLYYIGPMFRRERPQKGRYRQFYQIGVELLGASDHPAIDAEVIEMLLAFFERIGLKGAALSINSIGDKQCRPQYIELLRAALRDVKDVLGADSQRRIETNPLRVLDSKLLEEQPIIEKLPRIADHLCDACREHYAELKRQLALRGVTYSENWRLVRGLDYYMRTTFEVTATGLGSQDAVCGGGRYDGLVEQLGGPAGTKGIGFAIGTDRVILSLEQQVGDAKPAGGLDVYLAWMGAAAYPAAVTLAQKLRRQGTAVELPAVEMKFGKSLNLASRLGAQYAVIIGDDELAAQQFTVKRLADGDQKKLSESDLLTYLLPRTQ